MSDLHPTARALIEAAKRREQALPDGARARVHRSVLRRAAAFGAAVATTTTTSVFAKAGAAAAVFANPLVSSGVVTALAGVAFVIVRTVWMPPVPSAPMHDASSAPAAHALSAPVHREVPSADESLRHVVDEAAQQTSEAHSSVLAPASIPPPRQPLPMAPSATPRVSGLHVDPPPASAANDPLPLPVEPGSLAIAGGTANDPPLEAETAVSAIAQPPPSTTPPIALALEVLHQVHEALRGRRPAQALTLLDRHAVLLQSGPLAEEAQAGRISALCQMGRDPDARAEIDHLVATWPHSPLASRLRVGCRTWRGTAGQTE
jgi:hypothetical protein